MKDFTIQDQQVIDEQIVRDRLLDHDRVKIQFSKPVYNDNTLAQIDKLTAGNGANLLIRFYHDGFDCANLEKIPNVKALSIDCIRRVNNITELKNLKFLSKVGLGIFELDNMDVLAFDSLQNVDRLSIFDTKSKALNLDHLKHYTNLVDLTISGHTKNINALAMLSQLKKLTLWSITKTALDFVNNLKSLVELNIFLRGRKDINEIGDNAIEHLTISWVKGFNDLSGIGSFKNLKTLLVEKEIQLEEITFPPLNYLEDVKILDCKSLKSINGLEKLRSLKGLRISTPALEFNDFVSGSFPESLKKVAFYTWKSKQDKLNRDVLDTMGFKEY